jgi:hypothetical protein
MNKPSEKNAVIPAQAESMLIFAVAPKSKWIPASAGMT